MAITRCPNCQKEFLIGEETIGKCPYCEIKLIFRGENEIVEKVDICDIEKKVDEIISVEEIEDLDKLVINTIGLEKDISKIEEEIDRL